MVSTSGAQRNSEQSGWPSARPQSQVRHQPDLPGGFLATFIRATGRGDERKHLYRRGTLSGHAICHECGVPWPSSTGRPSG